MTDDLITWLCDQLDEEERVAMAAQRHRPAPWVGAFKQVTSEPDRVTTETVASTEFAQVSHHIARWHPARVLAEVEAKRRILDDSMTMLRNHRIAERNSNLIFDAMLPATKGLATQAEKTLRWLAQPYADRPGYREEWRP